MLTHRNAATTSKLRVYRTVSLLGIKQGSLHHKQKSQITPGPDQVLQSATYVSGRCHSCSRATSFWIDSLCITQDQEDDWSRHAGQMDKIYENVLLVVAAVSSSAASVPFLGPDAPTVRASYPSVRIETNTEDNVSFEEAISSTKARTLDHLFHPCEEPRGPLEERAWAWQERHFAARTISFTAQEAKWVCEETTSCECYGSYPCLVSAFLKQSADKTVILWSWRNALHWSTNRNLTYETDRLPAIAGVASRIHTRLSSNYIAGLWEVEMPLDLSWYRWQYATRSIADLPPAQNNGVPSWSWA
jgi:hypothetical protein